MGCCGTRTLDEDSCEKLLQLAENSIGLATTGSKEIDRVFHRHSSYLKMSKVQFAIACRDLKINIENPDVNDFFLMFYKNDLFFYCVRKLSLVGILFGKATVTEKVILLFQNYDGDASKTLEKSEVKLMLQDIFEISFSSLAIFASKLNGGANYAYIDKYKMRLNSMKSTLMKYFMIMIFEDNAEAITFEKFGQLFTNSDLTNLLSSHELRTFSKELMKSIVKIAEAVGNIDEILKNIDDETAKRLGLNKQVKIS